MSVLIVCCGVYGDAVLTSKLAYQIFIALYFQCELSFVCLVNLVQFC